MVLAMTGHEKALMRITLATGVLTVATVVLGGRLWGFPGVAVGYVVGSSGQQLAAWLAVLRLTGLRTDINPLRLGVFVEAVRGAARRR
jgi:O-antigen/teichoic acid export membrane protein